MAIPVPTISATGITAPSYADILSAYQNAYYTIYGSDSILTPESQDGQWLAVEAQAYFDLSQAFVAVYGSFSPATAQSAALSSNVKINGLARHVPTASTATVTLIGVAGTTLTGALIGDNQNLNTQWAVPTTVIPSGGSIAVTATCTAAGAVPAAPNTLVNILTPTAGWQTCTNTAAATLGAPVESDAALRVRQAASVALPALTPLESIRAAVADTAGVGRTMAYENDTNSTDSNGMTAHSIGVVVEGGSTVLIATAIAAKKSPGSTTCGGTSYVVTDSKGVTNTIHYYGLVAVPITMTITVKALAGYLSSTGDLIKAAVVQFIGGLDIGEDSYLNRLYGPANLRGSESTTATGLTQATLDALSDTYNVTSILQARTGSPAAADVAIAFNEAATCTTSIITIVVT